ncbi:HotDog domain-containing protein [Peziza echinospora]|nr:HotDog domain-containing protein [Peziza echinospora]
MPPSPPPPKSTIKDDLAALRSRRRSDYRFQITHHTRFSDCDQYNHVNNAIYNHLIDTAINTFLLLPPSPSPSPSPSTPTSPSSPPTTPPPPPLINLTVSSTCTYLHPLHFPSTLHLALLVTSITHSTTTYEVGIFEEGREEVCAVGVVVQVWVARGGRRAVRGGGGGGEGEGGVRRWKGVVEGREVVLVGGIEEGVWVRCRGGMKGGGGGGGVGVGGVVTGDEGRRGSKL